MRSERVRIWCGFLIVCYVWGSTWLAIKVGLSTVPPFLSAGLRFTVASAILFGLVRVRRVRIPLTTDAKKLYAILAILSYAIPYALVYWGEQYVSSGLCSIIFAAYPFCVAIFSQFLLADERLNAFKVAGILCGFAGLVIIFAADIHLSDRSALLGMSAVLLSTIVQGLALVLIKKYGQPVSPFAMNFVGMLFGAAGLLAMSLIIESYRAITWNTAAVGSILYLAVVGSVLAFVTYHWLLKRIEAIYLSLVSFINPIVAVLLGAMVMNETLGSRVFVGAGFVLAGILVANGRYFFGKIHEIA